MILTDTIRAALEGELQSRAFGGDQGPRAILLQRTHAHSVRLFYGAAAMSMVLFIVMIVLLLAYREQPRVLAGLGTVFGTSIAGLIGVVLRISKSVTQAGLLIAIVSNLPREDGLEAIKSVLRADSPAGGRTRRTNRAAAKKGMAS